MDECVICGKLVKGTCGGLFHTCLAHYEDGTLKEWLEMNDNWDIVEKVMRAVSDDARWIVVDVVWALLDKRATREEALTRLADFVDEPGQLLKEIGA